MTMSKHVIIKSQKPRGTKRRSPLISYILRTKENTIADVRRCLYDHSLDIPDEECRKVYRTARLRILAKNPMQTIRGYKDEMEYCLRYGNKEAHYVEGLKQYFALHNRPRGMKHLKFAASRNYKKATYLYALLKLHAGDHVEGMEIMDSLGWKNNTFGVDKLWRQVKRSLRDVPIINKRSYGRNMMLIMPPRSCRLNELGKRCHKCFYYKEMDKFLELLYRG